MLLFRAEYLQKSKHLQEQLSELRSEIDGLKLEDRQTDIDRQYQETLTHGDDKYSTLRKVRMSYIDMLTLRTLSAPPHF